MAVYPREPDLLPPYWQPEAPNGMLEAAQQEKINVTQKEKISNSVVCGESIQSNTGEAAALSSVRLSKILQSEKNRRLFKIALHFPFFKDLSPPSFSLLQSSSQNQSVLTLILK